MHFRGMFATLMVLARAKGIRWQSSPGAVIRAAAEIVISTAANRRAQGVGHALTPAGAALVRIAAKPHRRMIDRSVAARAVLVIGGMAHRAESAVTMLRVVRISVVTTVRTFLSTSRAASLIGPSRLS